MAVLMAEMMTETMTETMTGLQAPESFDSMIKSVHLRLHLPAFPGAVTGMDHDRWKRS